MIFLFFVRTTIVGDCRKNDPCQNECPNSVTKRTEERNDAEVNVTLNISRSQHNKDGERHGEKPTYKKVRFLFNHSSLSFHLSLTHKRGKHSQTRLPS